MRRGGVRHTVVRWRRGQGARETDHSGGGATHRAVFAAPRRAADEAFVTGARQFWRRLPPGATLRGRRDDGRRDSADGDLIPLSRSITITISKVM